MSTFAVFGMNEHFAIRAKIKLPQSDVRRKSATKISWMDYSPESTAAA